MPRNNLTTKTKNNSKKQTSNSVEKNISERKSILQNHTEKKALQSEQPITKTAMNTPTIQTSSIATSFKDAFVHGVGFSLANNIVSGFFRNNSGYNNVSSDESNIDINKNIHILQNEKENPVNNQIICDDYDKKYFNCNIIHNNDNDIISCQEHIKNVYNSCFYR